MVDTGSTQSSFGSVEGSAATADTGHLQEREDPGLVSGTRLLAFITSSTPGQYLALLEFCAELFLMLETHSA